MDVELHAKWPQKQIASLICYMVVFALTHHD